MELTWQDISKIVRLYNKIEREDMQNAVEWSMNEDNTGISYDTMTHEDICKQVLLQINKTMSEEEKIFRAYANAIN